MEPADHAEVASMLTVRCLISLTALLVLTACSKPPAWDYHESGKYLGKLDPLVTQSATPEHAKRLQERFASVQMDR
jgi:hypothetical protein